ARPSTAAQYSKPGGMYVVSSYPLRYLPNSAVWYPLARSHAAIVDWSWNEWKPPNGSWFPHTPVWLEYCPVRIDARLGQQSESDTKPLVNVTPWADRSRCTFGMAASVSNRWSSVRISTMLGGPGCGP